MIVKLSLYNCEMFIVQGIDYPIISVKKTFNTGHQLDGPNAPFYRSLIETGLGTGFSPSSGILIFCVRRSKPECLHGNYFSCISNIYKQGVT
jgi:hypothetical protein